MGVAKAQRTVTSRIYLMDKGILAIVVPCYNEEAVLPETNRQLRNIIDRLYTGGKISNDSFILYVNDGSKDSTWTLITQMCSDSGNVHGVNLAGNVGHQNALMAGLSVAKDKADMVITIDADLQDDVNVMAEMVEKCQNGGCDIVYGVRRERNTDTWFKRNTALAFYKLMHTMGVKSVYNHADYRLMTRRAVEQLCQYEERNLFLRGIVPLIGYKTDVVYYDRAERFAGESKYPLSKMVNFAIDGITSFSVKPVRMILYFGVLFVIVAFCVLLYVLKSLITYSVVPGWSSLMLSIWFCSGFVLIGIGVIGEYIGKIYIESKHRPRYNIESVI